MRLAALSALLLSLLAPAGSDAAEPPGQAEAPPKQLGAQPPASRFGGEIDVVEVEVPVEVRDRDGQPVRGLTAADFRIVDSGKVRPITRFEVIDLAALETAPNQPPIAPTAIARPRHILLLFDLTFSNPIAIGRARAAARRVVLESLHPTDLAAVATFSVEYGPRLLVTFTPDRAQLARAIDSLAFDRASEYRALDPLRFLVPFSPNTAPDSLAGSGGEAASVRNEVRQIAGETAQILAEVAEKESRRYETSRVMAWTRGLGELARYLASVGSRKQVLLFSEGFDSELLMGRRDPGGTEAQSDTQQATAGEIWRVDSDARFGSTPLMSEASRMVEELRRADCVVHSIDTGGLRAAGLGRQYGRSAGEDTLFYFANESGGQMFNETNDLSGPIRKLLQRTETSYVLGFSAEDVRADGAWRKLRVELVDRKGLKVVHRSGWYAPRPFPELHPFERDLIAAEAVATGAPKNEIVLSLLAAPFRAGRELAYVPVVLEIDGKSLLAGLDGPTHLDLYAYATTRSGEFKAFFHRDLFVDPSAGSRALAGGGLKYYGHFDLPPDDYLLRVLVREGEKGRIGTARLPLTVPNYASETATLLPPFFLDEPGRWTMLRERTASTNGSVVYPFVVSGDPFVPQAGPRFRAGERPRLALVGYNLGVAELDVQAVWLTDAGEVPAVLAAVSEPTGSEGVRHWLAELDLDGVAAGAHRIRITIVERGSGRRLVATESALRVET